MTPEQAIAFVAEHGVVLAAAQGPVPRLAEVIANEPIKGSWWAHPKSHQIFTIFQALSDSDVILVCRLVNGKVTFVHRRLWPALVRAAAHFPVEQLAQVHDEHTAAGHHVSHDIAFPKWVPPAIMSQAALLDEQEALRALGPWASQQPLIVPRRKR